MDSQELPSEAILELLKKPDAIIDIPKGGTELVAQFVQAKQREMKDEPQSELDSKTIDEAVKLAKSNLKGYPLMCHTFVDWMSFFDDKKMMHDKFLLCLKKSIHEINNCDDMTINNVKKENRHLVGTKESNDDKITDLKGRQSTLNDMIEDSISKAKTQVINEASVEYFDESKKNENSNKARFNKFENEHDTLMSLKNDIKDNLSKLLKCDNNESFEKMFNQFAQLAMENEINYVECFHILSQYRKSNFGNVIDFGLIKIEHRLQEYAKSKSFSLNLRRLYEVSLWSQGVNFDNECRTAILELLKRGHLTKTDVSKLYNYYHDTFKKHSNNNSNNVFYDASYHMLMIELLQSEKMISYLIGILFAWSETLYYNVNESPAYKHTVIKFTFLLGYAMTVSFETIESMNGNNDTIIETTNETQLNKLIEKLTNICKVCNDRDFGNQLSEHKSKQDALFKNIVVSDENEFGSLIGFGIFKWIHWCMVENTKKYFDMSAQPYITPLFISLLSKIGLNHSFLANDIVKMSVTMIGKDNNLDATASTHFQESFLELMIFIMQLGNYVVVFDALNQSFLQKLDRSLCRVLINHIIDTIRQPLPQDFVESLCNVLRNTNMIEAIKSDKQTVQQVKDFVKNADSHQYQDILQQIKEH